MQIKCQKNRYPCMAEKWSTENYNDPILTDKISRLSSSLNWRECWPVLFFFLPAAYTYT